MKSLVLAISVTTSVGVLASPTACKLTDEQFNLVRDAHHHGQEYGYGETLAAIVAQESFVGGYIIPINAKDGKYGSYGVTHVKLETAMWLTGVKSAHYAKMHIAPRLIEDRYYAYDLAIAKLQSVDVKGDKTSPSDWHYVWNRYNGNSTTYSKKIAEKINTFRNCGAFGVNWE